jgi:hypothetical protein
MTFLKVGLLPVLVLLGGCTSSLGVSGRAQDGGGGQANSVGQGGAAAGGTGGTCTGSCPMGATQCLSSTSLQTCTADGAGYESVGAQACDAGLVCERSAVSACLDPNWAEWPMPNLPADVTAGAPNPASVGDNGDGTVTDNVTGLVWQQTVAPSLYAWSDALALCPTLTLAGHTDWRLPSAIELVSIVDYGQAAPSISGTYFPATPSAAFWSSSIGPTYAWKVDFNDGSTSTEAVTGLHNVRCVR